MSFRNLIFSILCLAATNFPFAAHAGTSGPNAPDSAQNKAIYKSQQYFDKLSSSLEVTPTLRALSDTITTLVDNGKLRHVEIVGSSSPDGSEQLNERLAMARARAVASYLRRNSKLPDDLTSVTSVGENWPLFRQMMLTGSYPYSKEVIEILDRGLDNTRTESILRYSKNGRIWRSLTEEVFPLLRTSLVTVTSDSSKFTVDTMGKLPVEPAVVEHPVAETIIVEEPVADEATEVIVAVEEEPWSRKLWVKTNAVGWGLAMINAAAELDFAPNWSVTLPVYYSGFNYFSCTRKFRTITVLPEARYWFRPDNNGFFVGAHFGFSFYNYANNGDYRYQDHGARRPAYGGGLSAGYRFNFTRNPRWKIEISLGAGVYGLYYDRFRNVHGTDYGLLVDTRHRTLFCLDTASLSFCYSFDLSKKKGGIK